MTSARIRDTMWRRACVAYLRSALARSRSASLTGPGSTLAPASSSSPFVSTSCLFSSDSGDGKLKKRAEDAMPIAAGIERVELEAELEVKKRFENIDEPVGPFGTKEAPAIIQSRYDKRIVGCPGGEGEDEHHVIWFWLEKGKPHECPICSQYFVLEVVGKGGPPP
ncbi:cytochrome c oxidase subunit 5b-2, mitochondrial-like [Zingiber officinale]|uniref:cytochrome c oxidase subunit 5b-2, mitochondrial-like n=1 Tax=Zingiber officinale TaxID=94328 RepID=UPI001C4D6A26|nr:cytochrome c oxidase subunit 5b-2, mitochondrial-like [Zingiber officinale]